MAAGMRRVLLIFSLVFPFQGTAAPVPPTAEVTATECALLAHSVTVFLSKGVKAAYVCELSESVIGFSACHPQGRRNSSLSDGSVTATGIVYTARSNGAAMKELPGCPSGDDPIPDQLVPTNSD